MTARLHVLAVHLPVSSLLPHFSPTYPFFPCLFRFSNPFSFFISSFLKNFCFKVPRNITYPWSKLSSRPSHSLHRYLSLVMTFSFRTTDEEKEGLWEDLGNSLLVSVEVWAGLVLFGYLWDTFIFPLFRDLRQEAISHRYRHLEEAHPATVKERVLSYLVKPKKGIVSYLRFLRVSALLSTCTCVFFSFFFPFLSFSLPLSRSHFHSLLFGSTCISDATIFFIPPPFFLCRYLVRTIWSFPKHYLVAFPVSSSFGGRTRNGLSPISSGFSSRSMCFTSSIYVRIGGPGSGPGRERLSG